MVDQRWAPDRVPRQGTIFASTGSYLRLRCLERNKLRRIVNNQADIFVPGWNESILSIARNRVSCTRSSARSTFLLSEMAKARKFGTASSIVSRAEGGKLISPILGFSVHQFAEERP